MLSLLFSGVSGDGSGYTSTERRRAAGRRDRFPLLSPIKQAIGNNLFGKQPSVPNIEGLKELLVEKDEEILDLRGKLCELQHLNDENRMIAVHYRNLLENIVAEEIDNPLFMTNALRAKLCMLDADLFLIKHEIENGTKATQKSKALFVSFLQLLAPGNRVVSQKLGSGKKENPKEVSSVEKHSSGGTVFAELFAGEIERLKKLLSRKDEEITDLRGKVFKLEKQKEEAQMHAYELCDAVASRRTMEPETPLSVINALKAKVSAMESDLISLKKEMEMINVAKSMWKALFYAFRTKLMFYDLLYKKIGFEAAEMKEEHKALCDVLFSLSIRRIPSEHVKHVQLAIGDAIESLE